MENDVSFCIFHCLQHSIRAKKRHSCRSAYVLPDLEVVDMTPWKYRKPVIAVTFILLAGIYVLFSPLGLGG